MDRELLRLELEVDAAYVVALTLAGRGAEADTYVEASGYQERLTAWQRSAQLPAREALPLPPDG